MFAFANEQAGIDAILDAVRTRGVDGDYTDFAGIAVARDGDVLFFDYTAATIYSAGWTPITYVARGLIINGRTGQLLARPFPKFFNLGELPETQLAALPQTPCEVTSKEDGSLGILFRDGGTVGIATRLRRTNAQSRWATAWLHAHADLAALPDDLTLLFEIIYPENRVILDHGDREALVLIGARLFDGTDLAHDALRELATQFGLACVQREQDATLAELAARAATEQHREGWVARLPDGTRIKVKTTWYLHQVALRKDLTPLRLWRDMQQGDGNTAHALQSLPEEFRRVAEDALQTIRAALGAAEDASRARFIAITAEVGRDPRVFAARVQHEPSAQRPILFALLHDKPLQHLLHKTIAIGQLFADPTKPLL